MITISGLSRSFGSRVLFDGADLRIGARDRVAVVGPNGSGKTTLFEMIAGRQTADSGAISITSGATLGYLEQETDALRGKSVLDELLGSGTEIARIEHRLAVLHNEMAELPQGVERDRAVAEYGRLQDRFQNIGGYSAEAEARRILGGLGFATEDAERDTGSFSGGWQMRIVLARLLLERPDVLLLDEPTNHLDLASVEWLERYLAGYEGAVLMISHDRDFMNAFAERVVEIAGAKLHPYTGNFSDFVRQKEEADRRAEIASKRQAERREQLELFINRFRYKESKAKQVQSKIKLLERMEPVAAPQRRKRSMHLRFPDPPRSGRVVVSVESLGFSYGDVRVYEDLEFAIERGQKIAFVGPNGAGKSTLLKLLAGVLVPGSGAVRLGHKVATGYFAQHQVDALQAHHTVLQELVGAVPKRVDVKPRDLLGRFLFSGDDIDKRVQVLSGGEKTRLALAKLLVQPFNFLCLDEPTNHLDMWARDVLEAALSEYTGALVLITHDRHLIRSVADHIVEVVDGKVTTYAGDYDYYLFKKSSEVAGSPTGVDPVAPERGGQSRGKEKRRRAAAERERTKGLRDRIAAIESELESLALERGELSSLLSDPASYGDGVDVKGTSERFDVIVRTVSALESEWDELTEDLEAVLRQEGGG